MKNKLRFVSVLVIAYSMVACQKTEKVSTHTELSDQQATVAVTTANHNPEQIPAKCQSVDLKIKALANKFAPLKLNDLNQLLKQCIAHVPLSKRYQWIQDSEHVYDNLFNKSSSEVYQYMTDSTGDHETLTADAKKALYAKLKPDEQYLVDHAKALYLEKYYIGEGEYTFLQHPQYYIDLFVPHLETADQVYFKQLRKEYTGSNYILDAGLAISFDELTNRLIFWENYLKQYPKAHYQAEVKDVVQTYREDLFRGHDNTRTLWFDTDKIADEEALKAIQKLAKSQSPSSQTAQAFLTLIHSSEDAWQQLPKPAEQDDLYDSTEQQDIRQQRELFRTQVEKSVDEILSKK